MQFRKRVTAFILAFVMMVPSIASNAVVTTKAAAQKDGFVTTNGTKFWQNGGEFPYAGTNCYYINFKSKQDIDNIFEGAQKMGINVLRTWGHLDAGVIQKGQTSNGKQVFQDSADGSGEKDGVYYQYFDKDLGKPVVNEGENGLQRLDYCLAQAKKHNVKLIITFTNNWEAFGGMKQYVKWAGLNNHDDFYTNETIKGWYKDYIHTLLNRENVYTGVKYKDDPTVFAWELSNEPRATDDKQCKDNILYNWVEEMSAYVKSEDSNHMVSIGDEGFFNYEYNSKDVPENADANGYIWHGSEGVDYEKLIGIKNIDFGTPHIYIKDWNMGGNGGTSGVQGDVDAWLKRHAEVTHKLKKPVILEEFGYNKEKEKTLADTPDKFFEWMYDKMDSYGYAGSNFWMLADFVGVNGSESNTPYINYDGYNVYSCTVEDVKNAGITDEAIIKRVEEREPARKVIVAHNKKIAANADNNAVNPSEIKVDLADVQKQEVSMKLQTGASFKQLTMNGKALILDKEYTVSGNTVTFSKGFLSSLPEGLQYITFEFSQGKNPEVVFDVYDSRITSAQAQVTELRFDKNIKCAKDLVIPVEINDGGALTAVKLRGEGSARTALKEGTDYTYQKDGDKAKVTLKAQYLVTLQTDEAVFELDYEKGSDPVVTVTVKDTTGQDIIDNFENYADNAALNEKWTKNNYGSHVEGALAKNVTDSTAMEYKYELGNYCGLTKSLDSVDADAFTGVSFWYKPDDSKQKLTIQLRDAANNYWETYMTLNGTEAKTVKLPFSEFVVKKGYGDENAVMGAQPIKEFSIYVDKVTNDNTRSSLYFDDIEFYADGSDVKQIPVTGVRLDQSKLSLKTGQTKKLNATVEPTNATNKAVSWISSNTAVASVSGGTVTAKKAGTATIMVKTADGSYTATCDVTVTQETTTTEKQPTTAKNPTTEKQPTTEQPAKDEKRIYLLDDFSTYKKGSNGEVNNWKPLQGWEYSAGKTGSSGTEPTTISYDAKKEALKVDLDYTKDSDKSWSEAKINTWMDQAGIDISKSNQFRFDVTYPKEFDGFGVKIFANNYNVNPNKALIEAEASVKDKKDNGDGTITATVKVGYMKGITTTLNSICIGFVGKYSDFKGSIWVDNAAIYAVDVGVTLPKPSKAATKVDLTKMPDKVKMADSNATDEAAAALAYLKGVTADNKVLFGHQNDNSRTVAGGESDTKDITGSYSAVVAYDSLAVTGSELGVSTYEGLSSTVASAKKAAQQGAIISLSTHMPNFATMKKEGSSDFSKYGFESSKDLSGNCAENCLPGKDCNDLYNRYLDVLVDFAKQMGDTPVILRPLHENNGGWFWWGSSTKAETYKALYRYTVEYLQKKGVHNFIYEYSPNGPIKTEKEYLNRYPGDEYVDVLGFDYYDDYAAGGSYSDAFEQNLDASCKVISQLAEDHDKVAVIAEAGVRVTKESGDSNGLLEENNPITGHDWYNMVNNVAQKNNIAYFLLWANFSNQNFYVPYLVDADKCHELGPDFVDFYDSDSSVFADGTNYAQALKKTVTKSGYDTVSGYMIDPVNFQEVTKSTVFHASARNAKKVTFVITNQEDNSDPVVVDAVKNSEGIYEAQITEEVLNKIGKVEIAQVQLKGDDTVLATARYVSFGTTKKKQPAGTIDNFDYYYGDADYLDSKYCNSNSAGGCTSSMALTKKNVKDGTYAGAYTYSLHHVSPGTEVYTGVGRNLEVTDYTTDADGNKTNAISMWVKPDGQGQKLVIQMVSGGYEFEAYLTDFMKTDKAQYVTIPFTAMKPKVSGKVFDPSNITQMNFYCNSIRDEKEYEVSSTIYFDKIKAIKADADKIADVAPGSYVLSAQQLDGEKEEDRKPVAVTGVTLNRKTATVEAGKSVVLKETVEPEEATNNDVTWSSDDESVAVVNASGKVTGKTPGTATITVTTVDGNKTAQCVVTVTKAATTEEPTTEAPTTEEPTTEAPTTEEPTTEAPTTEEPTTEAPTTEEPPVEDKVPVTNIQLSDQKWNAKIGEKYQLTALVTPANATNPKVTYKTSDSTVVTVDKNGKMTAVGEGEAVVSAISVENEKIKDACLVKVTEEEPEEILVNNVELNQTQVDCTPGDTVVLTATVTPENATNPKLIFSSSDETVATVDRNGKVTVLAEGVAIITAKSTDGSNKSAQCAIVVTPKQDTQIPVTGVTLNQTKLVLKAGESAQLNAILEPKEATNKEVSWTSQNTSVATVNSDGKVTAKAAGTTVITVTTADGKKKAVCSVTVTKEEENPIVVTEVKLDKHQLKLQPGKQEELAAIVSPADAEDKTLIWKSTDESVAVVDKNGKVTAVGVGTATIVATSINGKKDTCTVIVSKTSDPQVRVESVQLDKNALALKPEEKAHLQAKVLPANAENKEVIWETSNPYVAVVNQDGTVTATGKGIAVITVTTKDGEKTAVCVVTVKEDTKPTPQEPATTQQPPAQSTTQTQPVQEQPSTPKQPQTKDIPVTSIQLPDTKKELVAGETTVLIPGILPANATNAKVSYVSSDTAVALVDENGIVTAVKPGVADIVVYTVSGKTASCRIIVKPAKVTGLKKGKVTRNKLTLKWKKQKGVTGYKVYKYDAKKKKFKLYKTTKNNQISVKKLAKGTSYKFKITAYKKMDSDTIFGAFSKVLKVKTKK